MWDRLVKRAVWVIFENENYIRESLRFSDLKFVYRKVNRDNSEKITLFHAKDKLSFVSSKLIRLRKFLNTISNIKLLENNILAMYYLNSWLFN